MARRCRRHQGRSSTSAASREVAIGYLSPMAPWRVRAAAGLAVRGRSADRLEPVLAKRGEVDQEVNRVGETLCECLLRIEHRFVS